MEFQKLTAPSLKQVFVQTIQDAIISGKLTVGEKLPSERELSAEMNISRAVVDVGLSELQNTGFVEIRPRQGAYVADYVRKGNMITLNAIMNYGGMKFDRETVRSILEIRRATELYIARCTIRNTPDEKLDEAGKLLGNIAVAKTPEEAARCAFDFWHELTCASGDTLVPLAVESFRKPITTLWTRFCRRSGGIDILLDNTRTFLNNMYARDLDSALKYVNEYMDRVIDGDLQIYDEP